MNAAMTASSATDSPDVLADKDPKQIKLMAEEVILVDHNDNVVGKMSKKDSHLASNDLPLHRAFSLFLFDTNGRLLLQRRAAAKVTFPVHWTNTVCSHPLYNPTEMGENDNNDPVIGAKRAAVRKMTHELGVPEGTLKPDDLTFMTRVHYRADSDGTWGEHEVDYIFVGQKNVPLSPMPNEVGGIWYVTKDELKDIFKKAETSDKTLVTPWFRHIVEGFAWSWWDELLEKGMDGLRDAQDWETVHHIGACGVQCSQRQEE